MQKSKKERKGENTHEPSSKTVTRPHPILFETTATVRATTIQTPAKEEKIYLLDSVFVFAKCAQNVKFVGKSHIT